MPAIEGTKKNSTLDTQLSSFAVRRATVADASVVASHRRAMFYEMRGTGAAALDAMEQEFVPWVRGRIASEEYLGWLAETEGGLVVAGVGLWLMNWPPHVIAHSQRRGYLLNVYTREDHRRRGLARRLVEIAMEWCRENGIEVMVLHASDAGRALYETMGFKSTNEMRILL
jgi:GNAT superfamily N-acetyltransferase